MRAILVSAAAALLAPFLASDACAEPMFLTRQYTHCTACHYSPTGGGLLTPYGQLLSRRELSTAGRTAVTPAAGAEDDPHGEQAFLYGALGDALGPVHLGLAMRPSHLRIDFPGGHQNMNLLMTLDLIAAVQKNRWTAYGTAGREPGHSAVRDGRTLSDAAFISYEHWVSYCAGWRSRRTCCRARTGTSTSCTTATARSTPPRRRCSCRFASTELPRASSPATTS